MWQSDWSEIHTLIRRSDWCEQHTTLHANIEFLKFVLDNLFPLDLGNLKKCSKGEKDKAKSVQEARYLRMQIMILKGTNRTFKFA